MEPKTFSIDLEIQAMHQVYDLVKELQKEARERIFDYILIRLDQEERRSTTLKEKTRFGILG